MRLPPWCVPRKICCQTSNAPLFLSFLQLKFKVEKDFVVSFSAIILIAFDEFWLKNPQIYVRTRVEVSILRKHCFLSLSLALRVVAITRSRWLRIRKSVSIN